eukprot:378898_1
MQAITERVFEANSFWIKMADFDPEADKYATVSLSYRGQSSVEAIHKVLPSIQSSGKMRYLEWAPSAFKVGLNNKPAAILEDDDISPAKNNLVMMGNNTCVQRLFHERICKKYDVMYSQRAFVHWYVSEGMEECEFEQARENLSYIEKDYNEVLCEMVSDDMDSDDDYD